MAFLIGGVIECQGNRNNRVPIRAVQGCQMADIVRSIGR